MTDDAKRPDLEPEMDEPVFRPDDATPEQSGPDPVQNAASGQTEDRDTGAPGRADLPDGEPSFDEPVFSPDEQSPEPAEPLFTPDPEPEEPADFDASLPGSPEPEFPAETDAIRDAEFRPVSDAAEPLFGYSGEEAASQQDEVSQGTPESTGEPFSPEDSGLEYASDGEPAFEPVLGVGSQDEGAVDEEGTDATGWVNTSPDSGMSVEPIPEKEYTLFDETPAADVAMTAPPRRKLGRTGPVWVIGGIVLVVVAGLVWLAISRLTGAPEEVPQVAAEPTVEQVEEATATTPPPTETPGPEATPTRVLLPVLSNVIVGDTDGQGVLLREEPSVNGKFVTIIGEGEKAIVLEPAPTDTQYPVDADGFLWYRIRVPGELDDDGVPLAGWSASNFFVMDEQ